MTYDAFFDWQKMYLVVVPVKAAVFTLIVDSANVNTS